MIVSRVALLLLASLASSSASPAHAAESDPYWAWRKPPDDITRVMDRIVNHKLVRGLADVNARRPGSCREAAQILTAPLVVTSAHFFRSEMRRWPIDRSPRGLTDQALFDRVSVYRAAPLKPFGHWVPLDPTLLVDDVLTGPDKIGHFFTNGYRSWERATDAGAAGADDDGALRAALLYGVDEEKGWLGLGIDGVFSWADLHAASAGVRYFDALCKDAQLARGDDGRWSLARPFRFADWIDPCWDESFAHNAYADSEAEPVRVASLEVCPLLVDAAVQARRARYRARGCHQRTQAMFAAFVADGTAPDPAPWNIELLCGTSPSPTTPPLSASPTK